MELLQKQNKIINWIKTNYKTKLTEFFETETDMDAYITDFVDLSKYQKSKQMFFDFSSYSYSSLSLDSKTEQVELHVIMTFRKANPDSLHNMMMNYAAVFYSMIQTCNEFDGEVDIVEVSNMDFYEGATADTSVKVVDVTINLQDEVFA